MMGNTNGRHSRGKKKPPRTQEHQERMTSGVRAAYDAWTPEQRAEHAKKVSEAKRGGQWAMKHGACVRCGTTERPHEGKGLCNGCYGRKLTAPLTILAT